MTLKAGDKVVTESGKQGIVIRDSIASGGEPHIVVVEFEDGNVTCWRDSKLIKSMRNDPDNA